MNISSAGPLIIKGTEEDLFRTSEEHNLQYLSPNSFTDMESLCNSLLRIFKLWLGLVVSRVEGGAYSVVKLANRGVMESEAARIILITVIRFTQNQFSNYSQIQEFIEHLLVFKCKVNNTGYDFTDLI